MSYTIDLSTHGRELKQVYDTIVSSDPDCTWAVFNYTGQSNALTLRAKGAGDLSEFVEEFDDGKVQYGFARVDYNNLPKFVLVGWVGEGVPERTKGYFNAHYSSVSKYFHGYHVQITARSSDDLSEQIILEKIHNSSGSKYSAVPLRPKYKPAALGAREEDWGDAEPVTETELSKVSSSYTPTKVDIHAIKGGNAGYDKPEPVKSSYEPVGKVDIAAIRAQSKQSTNKYTDNRSEPVKSSYQPIGKVDIAAIRAEAKKNPNFREAVESTPIKTPQVNDNESQEQAPSVKDRMKNFGNTRQQDIDVQEDDQQDEAPKSLKDRMAVYTNASSGRLTELPKPKVQNTVGSRFSAGGGTGTRGTAPALPSGPYGAAASSKAAAGLKDFGSEGGKTPAQLWAEKHAKKNPTSAGTTPPPPPQVEEPQQQELEEQEDYDQPSISSLRDKFAHATIQDDEPPKQEQPPVQQEDSASSSFSDITSKFARQAAPPPPPPREPSPEPVRLANPVARAASPEPEPELEPTRDAVPAPPSAAQQAQDNSIAVAQAAVSNAVGTSQGATAVAEYEYEVAEEGEIGFAEGELITNIEFVDTDWWQGTNAAGQTGLFPSNFVELRDEPAQEQAGPAPGPVPAAPEPVPEPQPAAVPAAPAAQDKGVTATAEFDYEIAEEGEIGFKEGELITHIEFIDDDWWQGTNAAGQTGIFPGNHVTVNQ